MTNASDGARIKVWPGAVATTSVTNAGGGTGYVRNVTYNGMHDVNDDCEGSNTLRRRAGFADIEYRRNRIDPVLWTKQSNTLSRVPRKNFNSHPMKESNN